MSETRERIQRLEQTKDEIVSYFLGPKAIDDPTKGMWVSDAKEAYYSVVAAYQMALGTKSAERIIWKPLERYWQARRAGCCSARAS